MTKFNVNDESFAPITIKPRQGAGDSNSNNDEGRSDRYQEETRYYDKHSEATNNNKMRQRKTTLCCLLQKASSGEYRFLGCSVANKANIFRFVGLCLLTIVILCCVYGLKLGQGSHKHHRRYTPIHVVIGLLYTFIIQYKRRRKFNAISLFMHYSLDSAYSVGDPVNARDLWLIVELQSDSRGRRTLLGRV